MVISIERGPDTGGQPVYQQIAAQIRAEIESGRLAAGERLPTIRGLARTLGVNRDTVALAYDELARSGLIEATVGRGTFVRQARCTAGRRASSISSPCSRRWSSDSWTSSAAACATRRPPAPSRCTRWCPTRRCIRWTNSAARSNQVLSDGGGESAPLRRGAGRRDIALCARRCSLRGTGMRRHRRLADAHARRQRRHRRSRCACSPRRATQWPSRNRPTTTCSARWPRSACAQHPFRCGTASRISVRSNGFWSAPT